MEKEWVGFHEVPGILLVRLMSRCNERCVFCMVADEIAESDDVMFDEAAARIVAQPEGTQIEFFGGEPTIYPRFLELLTLARSHGYYCSVASNLRIFHNEAFTNAVAALDPSQIYIRTSIYGDTAELHDYYTRTRNSYQQTVQGIHNIVSRGFPTQVNVVILRQNVDRLAAIVDRVQEWGVTRIKFGNLIFVDSCADHTVSLSAVGPELNAAIARAEGYGMAVTVEKTPVCVIDGRLDLLSTERLIYSTSRVYDDQGACGSCLVRRWCDGLDSEYARQYGYGDLHRISNVPAAVVRTPIDDEQVPELMKMRCVGIESEQPDHETSLALLELSQRVETRYGSLAVFPRKYVRTPKQGAAAVSS